MVFLFHMQSKSHETTSQRVQWQINMISFKFFLSIVGQDDDSARVMNYSISSSFIIIVFVGFLFFSAVEYFQINSFFLSSFGVKV
jgi:hypothetical protein